MNVKSISCSIEGCETKRCSRGWCHKHYSRWRVHGDPLIILSNLGKPLIERFEEKVELIPFSTCHWWLGTLRKGYGLFSIDGRMEAAHRVAYELYVGEIPEGLHVLHRCDNRLCVNPQDLFLGTNQDNMSDKMKKGRHRSALGESNGASKLTEAQVLEIRGISGMTQEKIGEMFGVRGETIRCILNRKSWMHI